MTTSNSPRICFKLAISLTCILQSLAESPQAAEEIELLKINSNLIDAIDSLAGETDPASVVEAYYGELSSGDRKRAEILRRDLARLIPDYEVAFAAADTAEVNSVLSNIAYRWAVLRTFHAEHFTEAARAELFKAYNELYLLLN